MSSPSEETAVEAWPEDATDPLAACPRCGGPTVTRYPGDDPENGPARRECRDRACQLVRDDEEARAHAEDCDCDTGSERDD